MAIVDTIDRPRWTPQTAPRDRRGRFASFDDRGVTEEERQRRLARNRALQAQERDSRTRVARRVAAIERQLRDMLKRQGRTVTVYDDVLVGQTAQLAVRLEVLRSEQTRGLPTDDNQVTRYANAVQRALARLRLRPSVLDDGGARPPAGSRIAYERRLAAEQAKTSREPTTTSTGPPDGRATAE